MPNDEPANPLGPQPERERSPLPAAGKPENGPEANGTDPTDPAEKAGPAPPVSRSEPADVIAALIATADQHTAEIDAMLRKQRGLERNQIMLLGALVALIYAAARKGIADASSSSPV